MQFPLPLGHKFGYNPFDISVHDCSTNFAEGEHLRAFQHHCMLHWDPNLVPSGRFDGPTQKVVVEVQRVSGLVISGMLNKDTWDAAYARHASGESVSETPLESTESEETAEEVVDTTPKPVVSAQVPAAEVVATRRGPGRPRKK